MSETKRSKLIHLSGYVIAFSLMFYVISIGPAAAIVYDPNGPPANPELEEWAHLFYSPLISVAESNGSLEFLFKKYTEFCIEHF
ncbi:hypothetical protein Pan241w_36770 [Gimesia alba]|uniref:Uncharacterized protein n=1 Tax=Gimesia alba TaxID=2527973 RepID=A0A517RI70_9PLAN|nr:hypothetical protein [Gimesia alba]QDT43575.1 hypothetical protein Pan241w_36770 [Gimesia alba]